MSAVFQQKMIRLRAGRIAKGERVGEQPRPGAAYGEFSGVANMLQGARGGFDDDGAPLDLRAKYMGTSGAVLKSDPALPPDRLIDTGVTRPSADPAPVRKAQHPSEYVSGAIAMDGMIARERLAKADGTGFPADRVDLDNPNKPAPKPPQGEAFDVATFSQKLAQMITNAVTSAVQAGSIHPATTVAKSQMPSAEGNKLLLRKGGPEGSVKITKRAVEPDDLTAQIRRMFPQAA